MSNSSARILVVDDAPLIRGLLVQVLRKYGYEVETAEDGKQAIEFFIKYRPDLILMDADMPVLDGVAACSRIRALPEAKYLPIIIVTAFVEREWVDRAYAAGATDYVTKPVNWDVLRNRIHYILQAKHAEEALFDEKEKAQVTLASIGDGVITTDAKGRVEYLNPVASKLTGWKIEEAYNRPLSDVFAIIDEATHEPLVFPVLQCLKDGRVVELSHNIVLLHRHGNKRFAIEDSAAPIKDRNGQIIGVVLVFHDVTENRKLTQELAYQAKHDALTGLFNLHEFNTRLTTVLRDRESIQQHYLLYMDLDQFKIVNDTCGHEAGDQLLKNVALILQETIHSEKHYQHATLARLGGDEFGLLLESCELDDATYIADRIRNSIEQFRFYWQGDKNEKNIFSIGVSIGLVPINLTEQAINQESILAMADAACYAAKNAGRNNVHVYHANDLDQKIEWLALLKTSLSTENQKRAGFQLFQQPIIPTQTIDTEKQRYEILLRLYEDSGQLARPGAFLSAAERYSLMPDLDRWVLSNLLQWLEQLPNEKIELLDFTAVNISGYSLNDKGFLSFVEAVLRNSPNLSEKVCFEIPETIAITNLTATFNFMKVIKNFGCRFSIDNFGSGLSSFKYLTNLPFDFLKIDTHLIQHMSENPMDLATTKAINEIARIMQIKTIANGVESQHILNQVKQLHIDYAQGYLIGKPTTIDD